MTDYRALCAELVDCLEKANWPLRHKTSFGICLDNARVALAPPEPPSLKEQALHAADLLFSDSETGACAAARDTIRRALEALDD